MTNIALLPRAVMPRLAPAVDAARDTIPNSMLRDLAAGKIALTHIRKAHVEVMATELLTLRALDVGARKRADAATKADAILSFLYRRFDVTGKKLDVVKVDTISAVLTDDLKANGWRGIRNREIAAVLENMSHDPGVLCCLDLVMSTPVMRGLRTVGGKV